MNDPTVPSPCIGVCSFDEASGCCLGCLRTLDEIAGWSLFSNAEKAAIRAQLGPRRRLFLRAAHAPAEGEAGSA
jgi:hypothetical protein